MRHHFETILRTGLALTIVASGVGMGSAQAPSPAGSNDTSEALKALDQVIEQNRKLEQQNHELMEQINNLRQKLAAQPSAAQPAASRPATAAAATVPAPAPEQLTKEAQDENAPPQDSRNMLPQASEGSPATFGEFNPGRGFNVAKGRYGSLSLSGYMAARYLNQLPPDQTATDHLGRPIAVEPRQDFQFHRVMLFSQGWLFSPKFTYLTFVWTVQDTNQVALGGALTYTFNKYATIGLGWNAYPGTQSLQGSQVVGSHVNAPPAERFRSSLVAATSRLLLLFPIINRYSSRGRRTP